MRKIIILLIFLFIYTCFVTRKNSNPSYDNSYILEIPKEAEYFITEENDDIILTEEEIIQFNYQTQTNSDNIYDLNQSSLTKEEVLNLINNYQLPTNNYYDNNNLITNKMRQEIKSNLNLSNIPDTIKPSKALTINRTNLKSFPTSVHFYRTKNSSNFDDLQETEVHLNEPLLVIHKSLDTNWLFVMTTTYTGWVLAKDIVYVNLEEYAFFTNSQFGIITKPSLEIDNLILDMGVKLPYTGINSNGYEFTIPSKDSEGHLLKKTLTIPRNSAHIGYLSYTKNNLYIQSIQYLNTPYRWGGQDYGVDCSSFVSNVYKTFGFIFPRNTSTQKISIGQPISLKNLSNYQKLNIISSHNPCLLYKPGHVLIYLGQKDNQNLVISASGNKENMQVIIEPLNNYLTEIDTLIDIA